jgi:hypothetical protein
VCTYTQPKDSLLKQQTSVIGTLLQSLSFVTVRLVSLNAVVLMDLTTGLLDLIHVKYLTVAVYFLVDRVKLSVMQVKSSRMVVWRN